VVERVLISLGFEERKRAGRLRNFLQWGIVRSIGGAELLVIVIVFVLLFGGKKIPELAKGLGQGIRNFKRSMQDEEGKPEDKKQD
jgi:sec-independent protein translocase protein TatA